MINEWKEIRDIVKHKTIGIVPIQDMKEKSFFTIIIIIRAVSIFQIVSNSILPNFKWGKDCLNGIF
jgi:hypothetical protein